MLMKYRMFRQQWFSLPLLVLSLLVGCATSQTALDDPALRKRYLEAVVDAVTAEPSEISKNLIAVVRTNPRLIWKNRNDSLNARVLVATWTDYNGYDDKIGKSLKLSREVWVTTVPEVKEFCRRNHGDQPLRLEQLLGLPPKSGKTKFVEMWVDPRELFRPSADPEITDSEAEIDFRAPNAFVKVSDEYRRWYNDLKSRSYGENGYPWTRLGYTYDWGKEDNHIGMSEFVIMPGATVEIDSVIPTTEYGQR
jgi:hypothetical protein